MGGIGAAIITFFMAAAAVSYNASLGGQGELLAIEGYRVTAATAFGAMGLAFELVMVAALFGVTWWLSKRAWLAATLAAIVWIIASAFAVHSARGFIATNVTAAIAPAQRNVDVYVSLKKDLLDEQQALRWLRETMVKTARRSERRRLVAQIKESQARIERLRAELAQAPNAQPVNPLAGIEWWLAGILWLLNTGGWYAFFGGSRPPTHARNADTGESVDVNDKPQNVVAIEHFRRRLTRDHIAVFAEEAEQSLEEPIEWKELRAAYEKFCSDHDIEPTGTPQFGATLARLGWRRERQPDGRTIYEKPSRDHTAFAA